MRVLIQFLINNVFFAIFLILEIFSLSLVFNFNEFQKSVFLSSSNKFAGELYDMSNSTTEYFGLRDKNDRLSAENAALLNKVFRLEGQLELKNEQNKKDSIRFVPENDLHFISAKVINNSTNKPQNYITLNKGSLDGIKNDMGVISDQGIVGVVSTVSEHFSVAISVLNPKIKISCKFKKNDYSGSLVWDGYNYQYAKFEDVSEHVPIKIGDTIITTGFSSIFPEKMPVGVVKKFEKHSQDSYYDIVVKLFTNFKTLSHVKIIDYHNKEEQSRLENSVQQ
jgi:rod shape-determining protein MreC